MKCQICKKDIGDVHKHTKYCPICRQAKKRSQRILYIKNKEKEKFMSKIENVLGFIPNVIKYNKKITGEFTEGYKTGISYRGSDRRCCLNYSPKKGTIIHIINIRTEEEYWIDIEFKAGVDFFEDMKRFNMGLIKELYEYQREETK